MEPMGKPQKPYLYPQEPPYLDLLSSASFLEVLKLEKG